MEALYSFYLGPHKESWLKDIINPELRGVRKAFPCNEVLIKLLTRFKETVPWVINKTTIRMVHYLEIFEQKDTQCGKDLSFKVVKK